MKKKLAKILIALGIILVVFSGFIYVLDKKLFPVAMVIADSDLKSKSLDIINRCILNEYSKDFNYDNIIKIQKDNNGNIVLLRADTLKLNRIANTIAIESKKKLAALGRRGIKLYVADILQNSIVSEHGPKVTVKMTPIGRIEVKYRSELKSAGINQVIHRIYVELKTKIRIVIATRSREVTVANEVPICETVIVGKVPATSINMDMSGASSSVPAARDK
ncbi:sporulation protein YunB [Clostridium oryzae]|uniref:Sporulation protein YunB n=1 Tax=Clostridium oryzae TaxID=1450648 RepID=A0A1V4IVX8_9CLOT|nr:sporulation protein YunB [Clostridium oryzae]OPJ63567.1 sporulation protein YunB [Clostridium oryzae]